MHKRLLVIFFLMQICPWLSSWLRLCKPVATSALVWTEVIDLAFKLGQTKTVAAFSTWLA